MHTNQYDPSKDQIPHEGSRNNLNGIQVLIGTKWTLYHRHSPDNNTIKGKTDISDMIVESD